MLFIIGMQNNYLDPRALETYIEGSETLIPGIIKKIKEYERNRDEIIYTLDISTRRVKTSTHDLKNIEKKQIIANPKEKWGSSLFPALSPHLLNYECFKKSYYGFSPDGLLKIQDKFKDKKKIIREIEFVGVETHICVLANAICIQSAFPDSKIIIDENLSMSNDKVDHDRALKLMENLGMEIRS